MIRARAICIALMLMVVATARVVSASSLVVSPVRVHLTAERRSETITIYNRGSEAQRLQVSSFVWNESSAGKMELSPTKDLIFHPAMLEVKPGESRKVRVASARVPAAVESSFRIFIEELPPPVKAGGGLRVLSRFGIPVFLRANAAKPVPALRMNVANGKLTVTLENSGSAYYVAQTIRVSGFSHTDARVYDESWTGWYVLAGGKRHYEFPLAKGVCESIARFSASAKTTSKALSATLGVGAKACTP